MRCSWKIYFHVLVYWGIQCGICQRFCCGIYVFKKIKNTIIKTWHTYDPFACVYIIVKKSMECNVTSSREFYCVRLFNSLYSTFPYFCPSLLCIIDSLLNWFNLGLGKHVMLHRHHRQQHHAQLFSWLRRPQADLRSQFPVPQLDVGYRYHPPRAAHPPTVKQLLTFYCVSQPPIAPIPFPSHPIPSTLSVAVSVSVPS